MLVQPNKPSAHYKREQNYSYFATYTNETKDTPTKSSSPSLRWVVRVQRKGNNGIMDEFVLMPSK